MRISAFLDFTAVLNLVDLAFPSRYMSLKAMADNFVSMMQSKRKQQRPRFRRPGLSTSVLYKK